MLPGPQTGTWDARLGDAGCPILLSLSRPPLFPEDAGRCVLTYPAARRPLQASLFFHPAAHSLAGFTDRAARKLVPSMAFLVQTPIDWALLEKGRRWRGVSGSLPSVLWLSLSLPCRRVDGSPGLDGHGVTGSVRRRSGAAPRVGHPGCRKRVSLGPGTLQFLCASSGARTSTGDAAHGLPEVLWW